MTPEDQLLDTLARYGDTADAIADRFRAMGIKGARHQAMACPIAQALSRAGYRYPIVSCEEIRVDDAGGFVAVSTPESVAEFVRRYDARVYLDLVEVA
jgi:hypothetical protein